MNSLLSVLFTVTALAPMQTPENEFVFNNSAEVESIDPQFATGVPDNNIIVQIFEGLMTRKADWVTVTYGQAESYKVSKDLKNYTFKLRKGLKWSDGKPLTAKDFEYAWLRAMHPKTMASYGYWLTDNIIGAAAYNKKPTPENAKKVGVKALDDLTFEVKLNKPVPYFIQLCAESITYPVRKDVVEKHGTKWTRPKNIVSNGPYKLADWKVQQKMELVKNEHYYNKNKIEIEKVTALPIEDRQTMVNMFRQGKLDWSGHNGAPNALVPAFKKDPNFITHPAFVTYYYRFNVTKPPLDDHRVRQALSLAIDRAQLTEKITRGGETPAAYFVPPKTGDYVSPKTIIGPDFEANVKKAKQLLAEAGYPNGKGIRKLKLLYNTDENHKRVAQAVQQMWKKHLGINVELANEEWKVYLKSTTALDFDIARAGWAGDYPDPATFLELFTSTSGNNNTGWKSPKYDELFNGSNSMKPGEARNKKLADAEALLINQAIITPFYFYTNFSFIRPEIKGFTPNLVDRPYVKYLSKKKASPAAKK